MKTFWIICFIYFAGNSAFSGDFSFFVNESSLQRHRQATTLFKIEGSDPGIQQAPQLALQRKSKGKAFLLSLLVPGLGERYVGSTTKATVFLTAEVTLWLGYSGFVTYRDWRKEDYKVYAASHAQVDLQGKSDSYFIDVGNYKSIYDYNAAKLRGRNLPEYYRDEHAYFWQWQSEAHRQKFDQLRIASDTANNRSVFVIGAILANHLLSAIDAVWSARKAELNQQSQIDLDVQFGDGRLLPNINVGVTARF